MEVCEYTTNNIKEQLKACSKEFDINIKKLDFNIIGMQTYFKNFKYKRFLKYTPDVINHYSNNKNTIDMKKFLKDRVELTQIFKIEVFETSKDNWYLNYELEIDDNFINPAIIIKPNSIIPKLKSATSTCKEMANRLTKIKALNLIIVNMFNTKMNEDIKALIRDIYKNRFNYNAKICLFDGVEPEFSVGSHIIEHYKTFTPNLKFHEVEENDLVLEFIKPKHGANGFSSKGKSLNSDIPDTKIKNDLAYNDEELYIEESDDFIKYISKKKGFVEFSKNRLSVSNKIVIDEIKSVEDDVTDSKDNEIELTIAQDDHTKDGVGSGVNLVSNKINIQGHVGKNANLDSEEVYVGGSTHSQSIIKAKNATVNRHKGVMSANEANVKNLEGGVINASYANIENALSGEVMAEHVHIKLLKSNVKIYASKSITIDALLGEDNYICIDPTKIALINEKASFFKNKLEMLLKDLQNYRKKDPKQSNIIRAQISELKNRINELYGTHMNASITIKGIIRGINKISFNLYKEEKTIEYITSIPMEFEKFHLTKRDDTIILNPVNEFIEVG